MDPRMPTLETHEDSVKDMQEIASLVAACRDGKPKELQSILERVKERKKDVDQLLNLKYEDEATPLHVACCHGNVDCIKLLLESGADANVYDARGFTSIHCAASNGHTQAIDTVLSFSPHQSDFTPSCTVDQRSEYDETPLHIACLMGNVNVVQFLLGKGADLESEDAEGNTFLHSISSSDSGKLWAWAIDTVNNRMLTHLVDKKNSHGQTPAHRAASLGCIMSISALMKLKAKFDVKDDQGYSAIDISHQYGNTQCYSIASGQQHPRPMPSSPSPTRSSQLQPPLRTLSGGSGSSPKLVRRSSMTGRKRPATVAISLPPSSSTAAHIRRNSLRSISSVHSRSSSMDSYLNVSRENVNRLSRLNSAATGSEETIQMVIDNSAYAPPLDLTVVEPVYYESITPKNSTIYCKEHAIKFSTKYFNSRPKTKPPKTPPPKATPPAPEETEIPVCIAAAMHLTISFPSDYTIISPVCFVSCRCEHTCRATLELPHAASILAGKRDKAEKELFSVLSFVTFDLKRSTQVESPSPVMERRLEPMLLEHMDIESNLVRFKTTIENPCFYAIGIKNSPGPIPRPMLPLQCAIFCLYKKYEEQNLSVSVVPIWMYVGLHLRTVTMIMKTEAQGTSCDIQDLLFKLSGTGVELTPGLNSSEDEWVLDDANPQKLTYSQIALTEESITGHVTYSHSISYPPHRMVSVLPGPGKLNVPSPIRFHVAVTDSDSGLLGRKSFVPFAPRKSTTATPNPSPPPSNSHSPSGISGVTSPGLTISTSSTTPPPLQSSSETNGVRGNGTVATHHTATSAEFRSMV